MIFTRFARKKGAVSTLAMAMALATGGAFAVTAVEAPALAQKKSERPNYSKGFIGAYKPLEELAAAEAPDYAALKAGFPTIVAAAETADDRYAAGSFIYANAANA